MIITNLQLDKGRDSVVLVTDTHHDRDEMRTLIETAVFLRHRRELLGLH